MALFVVLLKLSKILRNLSLTPMLTCNSGISMVDLLRTKELALCLTSSEVRKFEKYTNIVQDQKHAEPSRGQEWVYNYADNSISLKFNRNFVLDVAAAKTDNNTNIQLWEKHGGKNQQFNLQKWDDGSVVVKDAVTNIIDNFKFLPKLSQNFLEILDDDEYYDVNIEVDNFKIHLWRKTFFKGM
ncbi:unnamed protein product [Rhizophagus irregularis]|nr:unnamed protein product [Rhizophagus irregularis]